MNKLNLTKEEAKEMIYGTPPEGLEVVHNEQISSGRWHSHHMIVVKEIATGRLFADEYSMGLTESQENDMWENYSPDFTEVFPHKVESIKYRYEPEINKISIKKINEATIKEFIESNTLSNVLETKYVGNLPLNEYNQLFISMGYENDIYDNNILTDFVKDFVHYWNHETLPTLVLRGSLYYGNYRLVKYTKET
jgi:hypothetical protein